MTISEIVYDIKEITNQVSDDSDLNSNWLLSKVNMYRSVFIDQQVREHGSIDPLWYQVHPKFELTKTSAADDPRILSNSITVGKYSMPRWISLPEGNGIRAIMGSSGIRTYSFTDFTVMMLRISLGENISEKTGWVSYIGNDIFIYPFTTEAKAIIIADNPMEIPVLEDGVIRSMTINDQYPIDNKNAQNIVLSILSKDLEIKERQVSDVVNDSQDQLKILKPGTNEG